MTGCPRCGTTASRPIAPGYVECAGTVSVPTGRPPSGAFGPPYEVGPCGTRYHTGESAPAVAGAAAVCSCGTFAIGICQTCQEPVCGDCSTPGLARTCHRCRTAAAKERTARAEEVAQAQADRSTAIVRDLADAFDRWSARPTLALGTFEHTVDVSHRSDVPRQCPLGHPGCSLAKRRKQDKHWVEARFRCPAWRLEELPGWPDADGSWQQAWLTPDGRLIGDPSLSLRGPRSDQHLAAAREKEGRIEDLRAGRLPLVLLHHHQDFRDSRYGGVADSARAGVDARLTAIAAALRA